MQNRRIWGWLGIAALLFFLYPFGLARWVDPRPRTPLRANLPLPTLQTAAGEQISAERTLPLPAGDFDILLTAEPSRGEQDVVLALRFGEVQLTLSPLGYLGIRRGDTVLRPFAPFPHIHADAPNEIWLSQRNNTLTVRLNRELAWMGNGEMGGSFHLSLTSFGNGAAMAFGPLTLYSNRSPLLK